MNDSISRQAAIDSLHMHLMYRMGTDSNKKRLDEWINNLPPAPDPNWVEVSDGKPKDNDFRWLTVHSKLVKGYWDPHAKIFRNTVGVPIHDVTAWYKDPRPYPYGGYK